MWRRRGGWGARGGCVCKRGEHMRVSMLGRGGYVHVCVCMHGEQRGSTTGVQGASVCMHQQV